MAARAPNRVREAGLEWPPKAIGAALASLLKNVAIFNNKFGIRVSESGDFEISRSEGFGALSFQLIN